MTTLHVLCQGQSIRGLRASGHAGYARSGSDIVCAAVSVLMTTCANALQSVARISPIVREDANAAEITVELPEALTPGERHDAEVILQTALQGLADVAAQYPKHLHIIDGRNQSC